MYSSLSVFNLAYHDPKYLFRLSVLSMVRYAGFSCKGMFSSFYNNSLGSSLKGFWFREYVFLKLFNQLGS